MNTETIVQMLSEQRARIERALEILQKPTVKRGRPARELLPIAPRPTKSLVAHTSTPEWRKAQSRRMKAYWAARRMETARKLDKAFAGRKRRAA